MRVIRYIAHKDINKIAWDQCVDNAVNQVIYAFSWYLDIVSPGWDALVLGNYEAIMPLPQKKRFTLSYLAQPLFTQQLGVLYTDLEHMHATNEFIAAIPEKFKLIELNLNTYNIPSHPLYSITQNITCHLELNSDYEILKSGYSKQIKRNIDKAEKNHLITDEQITSEKIVELFQSDRGKKIKNFKKKNTTILLRLIDMMQQIKIVTCLGVKNKSGQYISGAVFVVYHDVAIFLFSGTSTEGKQCGAMSLLIDCFIKKHSKSPLMLDFEGSNNKNLLRFYLGFGSKVVNYHAIRRNNLPKIIRWVKAP